eukprot:7789208-Pyramimonas_sp.AAC.1
MGRACSRGARMSTLALLLLISAAKCLESIPPSPPTMEVSSAPCSWMHDLSTAASIVESHLSVIS